MKTVLHLKFLNMCKRYFSHEEIAFLKSTGSAAIPESVLDLVETFVSFSSPAVRSASAHCSVAFSRAPRCKSNCLRCVSALRSTLSLRTCRSIAAPSSDLTNSGTNRIRPQHGHLAAFFSGPLPGLPEFCPLRVGACDGSMRASDQRASSSVCFMSPVQNEDVDIPWIQLLERSSGICSRNVLVSVTTKRSEIWTQWAVLYEAQQLGTSAQTIPFTDCHFL